MPNSHEDSPLPDRLLVAIGRVATSSARLEVQLRFAVAALAGNDDAGWIIFEGQSIDQLLLNGHAVLSQYAKDDDGDYVRLGVHGHRLSDLFRQVEKWKNERNTVIHGDWRAECFFGLINEPETCMPRSVSTLRADEVFHVVRSRHRRGYEEQAWSLTEVIDVAANLDRLAAEIRSTYKEGLA